MTAAKADDNDELEAELAKIVLERVESQRREAGEHVIRQVAFRFSMQPLIGAIERLQGLGLRDLRQQLIRLQYLKPVEGVRIEFGRFVATIIAHRDGSCRVEMMRNEGSMIDVESHDPVSEGELSEHFRQIMHAIASESERPTG
ncbi:MAG: hypothetical protein JO021_20585 [Alphaproteobacteria bacterium]|nr:hypothetical protein [Alphaproteobacteria bacterium]